jgi:hypothetical protein
MFNSEKQSSSEQQRFFPESKGILSVRKTCEELFEWKTITKPSDFVQKGTDE